MSVLAVQLKIYLPNAIFIGSRYIKEADNDGFSGGQFSQNFLIQIHTIEKCQRRYSPYFAIFHIKIMIVLEHLWIMFVAQKVKKVSLVAKVFLKLLKFAVKVNRFQMSVGSVRKSFFFFQNQLSHLFRKTAMRLSQFSFKERYYRIWERNVVSFFKDIFTRIAIGGHKHS